MNSQSAVITIGNEILLGRTVNTNLSFLARELSFIGIPVAYSVTIQDVKRDILEALEWCWSRFDVVITTGGLGPTEDDISRVAIASFFGKHLEFQADIWARIQSMFERRGLSTPEINRCQAYVPIGFEALSNERGTAPGLCYQELGKVFVALQGVPSEMRYTYRTHVLDKLREGFPQAKPIVQKTLNTYGIPESGMAEILQESDIPIDVHLAWLPQVGRVDIRLYGENTESISEAKATVYQKLGRYIWSEDTDEPSELLIHLLRTHKLSISVAESCTGGLMQKMLTDIKGASDFFKGGVVTYHNDAKQQLLHVKGETLHLHGAVSPDVALEMVKGLQASFGTNIAVSITGIAGPDGGTAEKPIGTVYFGFAVGTEVWHSSNLFTGDRSSIRFKAAESAILQLVRYLKGRQ